MQHTGMPYKQAQATISKIKTAGAPSQERWRPIKTQSRFNNQHLSLNAKNPGDRQPVLLGHGGRSADDGGGAHLTPEPGQVGAGILRPGVDEQQRGAIAAGERARGERIREVHARREQHPVHREAQARCELEVGDPGARLEAGGATETSNIPDAGRLELALHRGGNRSGSADDDRPRVPARANRLDRGAGEAGGAIAQKHRATGGEGVGAHGESVGVVAARGDDHGFGGLGIDLGGHQTRLVARLARDAEHGAAET